jgi:hypothetical protein
MACRWSIPSTIPTSRAGRSAATSFFDGVEEARNLSPVGRRLVATGISGSIIPLSATHSARLSSIETRASTAAILNQTQTKFQLPEVH